jgi:hypothetical protein
MLSYLFSDRQVAFLRVLVGLDYNEEIVFLQIN